MRRLSLSADGRGEDLDDPLLVLRVDSGVERERDRAARDLLRYGAPALAEPVALAHVRLQVYARDVLRRRDAVAPELGHHLRAVEIRSELDHVDEPRAAVGV